MPKTTTKPADQQQTDLGAEARVQENAADAQLTATQEELAQVMNANDELVANNEAAAIEIASLKLQVVERDAKIAADREFIDAASSVKDLLVKNNEDLTARVAALESELNAAAAAVLHREPPDEARVHTLWCDAGGFPSEFEKVKRFLALLQG